MTQPVHDCPFCSDADNELRGISPYVRKPGQHYSTCPLPYLIIGIAAMQAAQPNDDAEIDLQALAWLPGTFTVPLTMVVWFQAL